MKKSIYLIVAVMAMAFFGCDHNKPQTNTLAQYDFLYLEDYGIYFYDLKTQEATRFANEIDSVVDVLCSKEGIVYYNVKKDNRLFLKRLDLKRLDLNVANAEPELLTDWGLKTNEVEYGEMYFNYDETQIALERDMGWWAGTIYNLAVYDCAEKTMSIQELYRIIMEDDEVVDVEMLYENETFDRWGKYNTSVEDPMDGVIEVDDYVYYVGEGQRVCLNDKINYDECVGFELGICDQEPISIDPTGKRILILVSVGMGDGVLGTYIMSSLDGKEQKVLEATDPEGLAPEWLPDGSLLYGCLSLMTPDGNVGNVAKSCVYCVINK